MADARLKLRQLSDDAPAAANPLPLLNSVRFSDGSSSSYTQQRHQQQHQLQQLLQQPYAGHGPHGAAAARDHRPLQVADASAASQPVHADAGPAAPRVQWGAAGGDGGGAATTGPLLGVGMWPGPATAASAAMRASGAPAVVAGRVQYQQLLAAAQGAHSTARNSAFQLEMAQIDGEIKAYVSSFKFEQNAPDAALAMQTAWRARRARVFFGAYMRVRRKHLAKQMALCFEPLKQLARCTLHARRRAVRRAFEEWRNWVQLTNDLFLRVRVVCSRWA